MTDGAASPFLPRSSVELESLRESVGIHGGMYKCMGCWEGILGFSYYCDDWWYCHFFHDKSCGKQPRELQHPLHPQHTLILLEESPHRVQCYFCNEYILRGFAYNCSHCIYNLHLKCASILVTVKAEFHDHPLKLLRKSVSFTCDAYGKEDKDMSYLCIDVTCPLMVHLKCAALPLMVKNTSHHHALSLTCSSQVNQSHRRIRRLCVKKVDTEKVYYCSKCSFVAHLDCATLYSLAYVVKKKKMGEDKIEIDEEINHFSHQHDLKLIDDQLLNNKKCDGCRHPIFPPFYSCAQCIFFLHKSCIALPRKKQYPLHPHLLTLLTKSTYRDTVYTSFACNVCGRRRDGFTYCCVECNFDADVKCSLISNIITHESHEHQLILSRASFNEKCSCCDYNAKGGVFRCADCEFTLDVICATLLHTVKYRYFEQPFKLCYKAEDGSDGEYYCDICEKERNPKHWFYYCEELNFSAHSKCILGTDTFDVIGVL